MKVLCQKSVLEIKSLPNNRMLRDPSIWVVRGRDLINRDMIIMHSIGGAFTKSACSQIKSSPVKKAFKHSNLSLALFNRK